MGATSPSLFEGVQVVILARGKGERLRPLTLSRPKAFCPVCNVPILNRLLFDLQRSGFPCVTLSLSQPAVAAEEWGLVQSLFPAGMDVDVRIATKPAAGSCAAVQQCVNRSARRILVIYGDSLLRADLRGLLHAHQQAHREQNAGATLLYHRPADRFTPEKDGRTYHGILTCGRGGRVTRFVEKPRVEEIRPGFDLANAAVFVIERTLLMNARFRAAADFSRDVFEPAVGRSLAPVYACSIGRGYRHDLGSIERLLEANLRMLSREWAGRVPGRPLAEGIWGEAGARVEGAVLHAPVLLGRGVVLSPGCNVGPLAILGDGCAVREGSTVRRTLLLQGCTVGPNAVAEGAVLGAHCRIGTGVRLPAGTGDSTRG